jgi:hypothetical protein
MLTVNSLTGFGIGSNSVGGGGGGSRPPYELVHADSDDADEPSEYTFADVNFGEDFTGRVIVVVAYLFNTGDAVLDQIAVTIGGEVSVGGDNGYHSAGGTAGVGIWAAQPTGTSGTVIVEHSGAGDAQGCVIKVLSLSGVASTTAHDTDSEFGDVAGGSATLDIPEDGILIVGVAREKHDRAVTIGNATEIIDEAFGTLGRVVLAVNDSLPSESNRPVSWTATAGGTAASGFICKSYG